MAAATPSLIAALLCGALTSEAAHAKPDAIPNPLDTVAGIGAANMCMVRYRATPPASATLAHHANVRLSIGVQI